MIYPPQQTQLPPASLDELVGAGEHGRHCGFGSATVEAPNGCEVASNRLASITKFATMLTTDIRNGANRRVSATGARAISISRPSERYLTSGVDARCPAIGSYPAEHTTTGPAYPFSAVTLSMRLNASLRSYAWGPSKLGSGGCPAAWCKLSLA